MRAVTFIAAAVLVLLALTLASCASAPMRRRTRDVGFTATAYCDSGITKSGMKTRSGFIAADPDVLPLGSVVRVITAGEKRYERTYTVMDTGERVQGRRIDIYVRSCAEARRFGVRQVRLEVVRVGPNQSRR